MENSESELPPLSTSHQIRFYRVGLNDLPPLETPDGYRLRAFEPGDEEGWAAALTAAFPENPWDAAGIRREFTGSDIFQPDRICLVERGGEIVGAAAAWERAGSDWGYVHWVGVKPDHQGKRLGRLVVLATLYRFREKGKAKVYLDTDEPRLPAISTYLSLGFTPDLRPPAHREMWDRIQAALGGKTKPSWQ